MHKSLVSSHFHLVLVCSSQGERKGKMHSLPSCPPRKPAADVHMDSGGTVRMYVYLFIYLLRVN